MKKNIYMKKKIIVKFIYIFKLSVSDNNCYFQDGSWICLAHQLDLSHTTTSNISLNLFLSLHLLQIKPSQLPSSNQSLLRFFLLSSFLQFLFLFSHSNHSINNHSQLFFFSFSCCCAQFLTRCVFTFDSFFQFQKWVWLKTVMMRRREPWRLEWVGAVSVYLFCVSFAIMMLWICTNGW